MMGVQISFSGTSYFCQFILVDNDVPDHIVDKLTGFIDDAEINN
ncbi:MAG: hypothetical protein QM504_01140 [Pseudomonadota bacterium]